MVIDNLEEILCKIIKNNRRVIIPNLGAFINNSSDGSIIFSPLLTTNDGFLVDELYKEGIDNPVMSLKKFYRNVLAVIENGSRFNIAGLGYFLKDESIQFIFETPIFATTDETNSVLASEEENIVQQEENTVQQEEEKPVPESAVSLVVVSISACLLIAASVFVLLLRLYGATEQLDPLISPPETSETQFIITDTVIDDEPLTPLANLNYHVIAGCFEEKLNAEIFIQQCKALGYDKSEILPQIGILYPVSICNFTTHSEAAVKKKEYDEKYGEDTWIYKTKIQ
ncbi:MAG: hypothetical protein LBT24_05165 [Tannerella sp.]|jgi:hypothetical protein|nr:hypothetical protein [Tannerella sp.]